MDQVAAARTEIVGPPRPSRRCDAQGAAERAELESRYVRYVTGARRALACALLAALLVGQVAYAFRSPLAARYPGFKSVMLDVCEIAGCSVSLPHHAELLQKVGEDVSALDTARPGLIQVTVTMRSGASYDLAYPALDLVLTNANEHALARDLCDDTRPLSDPKASFREAEIRCDRSIRAT